MPKRRSKEEDIQHYVKKLKKIERKLLKRQGEIPANSEQINDYFNTGTETPALIPEDWLIPDEHDATPATAESIRGPSAAAPIPGPITAEPIPGPSAVEPIPGPSSAPDGNLDDDPLDLDPEVLKILGEDPSSSKNFGPEVRKELACQLLHTVTQGLSKESRKELNSKYLVPENCPQIDAPKLNLEIKAAIGESAIKRDCGIEAKQKQMRSAIACLSQIINSKINSPRDKDELRNLMDLARILCDIQHADSVTRRNFILFSLKNEIKEHMKNTNIGTFLFGDNLLETLKSAKAVNRSGIDLKANSFRGVINKLNRTANRSLNRKAPPQARRPPAGQAPLAPRSHEPAVVRPPPRHPPQPQPPRVPAQSLRTSQAQYTTYPRRR